MTFRFIVSNEQCPYCYPEERMFCSHVSVQKGCNAELCPFKDDIVDDTLCHTQRMEESKGGLI